MPSIFLSPNPTRHDSIFPSPPPTPPSGASFSCFDSSLPISEITFYTDGDLILEVVKEKQERIHLRVASTALCIASPVFRAMLSRNRFREGSTLASCIQNGEVFILTLPEDDPESLITLCHILHFNNYKVPRTMTVEALANLCVLLDKYVCTLAAATWLDYWFSHVPDLKGDQIGCMAPHKITDLNEQTWTAMWLYISWVAGDRQKFKHFSALQMINLPSLEQMNGDHREWFERIPSRVQGMSKASYVAPRSYI